MNSGPKLIRNNEEQIHECMKTSNGKDEESDNNEISEKEINLINGTSSRMFDRDDGGSGSEEKKDTAKTSKKPLRGFRRRRISHSSLRNDSVCSEIDIDVSNIREFQRMSSICNMSELNVAERYHNIYSEPLDMTAEFVAPVNTKTDEQWIFIRDVLAQNFVFDNMGDCELKIVSDAMEFFEVEPDTIIISQGDIGDYFYVLEDGAVQFLVNGKNVRLGHIGCSFGELALLHDCPRTASCLSLDYCSLWRVDQKTFRRTLASHHIRKENEIMDVLRSVDIFENLAENKLRKIYDTLSEEHFEPEEIVFEKGTTGDAFYIVQEGCVRVKDIGCGRTLMLDKELQCGSFFGERSLITGDARSATIVAKTRCNLLSMNVNDFRNNIGPLEKLIEKSQNKQLLMSVPVINDFDFTTKEISHVASLLQEVQFKSNHTIYKSAQKIKPGLYLILCGKVLCTSASGTTFTLYKDDYFGDDTFLRKNRRLVDSHFTITTLEPTKCELLKYNSLQIVFDKVIKSKANYVESDDDDDDSHTDTDIVLERLEKHVILGVGTFGHVWLVSDKMNDRNTFALKIQSKRLILKYRQQENVIREKNIMYKIDHPFIIRMINNFQDDTFLYMVVKLYQGGELFHYIHTRRRQDDVESLKLECTSKFYSACILEALSHMHERQIVYRDLKPENVLFDKDGYCVIVDLGFAKMTSGGKTYTLCGTPAYIAPEVILQRGHDKSCDLWSLGVVIYELLVGITPFHSKTKDEIRMFKKICKGKFTSEKITSGEGRDLVLKLLTLKANERIGCLAGSNADIHLHPWFQDIDFEKLTDKHAAAPWIPKIQDTLDCSNFEKWDHFHDNLTNEKPPNISKQVLFQKF